MKVCSSYRCAGTQHQWTATLFRAKCSAHCPMLLCKNGLHQACITANTPRKICSSYRCAVRQLKCSATLVYAKCIPHCSVVLCKTGSQQASVTATAPVGICSSYRCAVTQHQCNTVIGKTHSPLLSAAVQDRFTAGRCHCNYTFANLLLIQVWSDPTPVHCKIFIGVIAVAPACCQAVLQSTTEQ